MNEKRVECGRGKTMRLLEAVEAADSSQGTDRVRECVGLPEDGSEDVGKRSNRPNSSSTMSCLVGTSPGFLSEYNKVTSRSNGAGQ